jgi:HD superfamily phosphodiesterase
MRAIYKRIYQRAKPFLNTRANEPHVRVSYQYALKLLKSEGGDPGIVIPSILLHDIGWKMIPEEGHLKMFGPGLDKKLQRIHERKGARMAAQILKEVGYPEKQARVIVSIIRSHDTPSRPPSLNGRIVKDSDRLWRFSRKGFTTDTTRFKVLPNEYLSYLETRIEELFFTKSAKRIAREEVQKRRKAILHCH